MIVTSKISVDLLRPNIGTVVNAVQGDGPVRCARILLLADGKPWEPPDGVETAVSYLQPTMHKGLYNLLEDGTPAISVNGNVAEVILAPQMLTQQGTVRVALVFNDPGLNRMTSFPFIVSVTRAPGAIDQKAEDYIRLQWLEDKLGLWLAKAEDMLQDYAERTERAAEKTAQDLNWVESHLIGVVPSYFGADPEINGPYLLFKTDIAQPANVVTLSLADSSDDRKEE